MTGAGTVDVVLVIGTDVGGAVVEGAVVGGTVVGGAVVGGIVGGAAVVVGESEEKASGWSSADVHATSVSAPTRARSRRRWG